MTQTIKSRAEALGMSLSQVQRDMGMSKATFWRRMADGEFTPLELNAAAHVLGYRSTAELTGEEAAA